MAALVIALCCLARGTRYRLIAPCLGTIAVLAIAASRIHLGVHFISDVIGSLLWVAGIMFIFTGLWNRYGLNIVRRVPVLTRFGPVPAK